MKYIPCNSALLAQKTLFLTQKGTVFQIYKSFGIREDPPPCWEKFPNNIVFFMRAYLIGNKIILLLIVALITTKKGGIIKKGGRGCWEYLGPKLLLTSIIFEIFHHIIISFCFFFPFSFPFPANTGNDSF